MNALESSLTSKVMSISPDSRSSADMFASSAAVGNFEPDYFVMGSRSAVAEEVAIANPRLPKNTRMTALWSKVALSLSKYWICWGAQLFPMKTESIFKEIKSKQTLRARKKNIETEKC